MPRMTFTQDNDDTRGAPSPDGAPRTEATPETQAALREALAACPVGLAARADDAPNPWRGLFYERLRDQALPALIADGTITPAASLWTGSRLWCNAFRRHDLRPGDRLVLALPPSAEFLQVLVAAVWERLSVVLVPDAAGAAAAAETLDARAVVARRPHAAGWTPDGCAGPLTSPDALRTPTVPRAPDVRFYVRTSGTTHHARWVALSDRNVLAVLASHYRHFRLRHARVLSVLPWAHAFGLVLDLLPALLSEAEIIRDPSGGRDPASILRLSRAWGATHCSAVPLTVQRLLESGAGARFLEGLQGGIVGGAPVSGPLAERLAATRLRAGYGQTEAAPGLTLGAPGAWQANYIGQPLGCEVQVDEHGELFFRGPNACAGFWRDGGLDRRPPTRWVATGDLVRREGDDLFFRGRTDDAFKLLNGRFVRAGFWEATLKQAFPALHDAFLYTPDGYALALAVRLADDAAADESADDESADDKGADDKSADGGGGGAPTLDAVRACLGPLGDRLARVHRLAPGAWPTSPKGATDRAALGRRLRDDDARTHTADGGDGHAAAVAARSASSHGSPS